MSRRLVSALAAAVALSLIPAGAAGAATVLPGISTDQDSATTTVGTLHLAVGDDFATGKDVYVAKVATADGVVDVPTSVTADLDPALESGDQVDVTTNAAGKVTAVDAPSDDVTSDDATSGGEAAGVASSALAPAAADSGAALIGSETHRITVIPVTWGSTAAVSTANVASAVTNLDSYYNTVSRGRIRVSLRNITPLQKVSFTPTSADTCSTSKIDTALKALYTSGTYATPANRLEHVVFLLPNANRWCSYTGFGSLNAWADGRNHMWLFDTPALTNAVFAHELGHNLGLEHSGAVSASCPLTTAKRSLPLGSCVDVYSDPWDIMGNSPYAPYVADGSRPINTPTAAGHMSAANLARLGLLSSTEQRTVTTSTTVTLTPVASTAGLRLVTIPYGTRTFTLEYRAATGLDYWINTPNGLSLDGVHPLPAAGSGVVLRERDGSGANSQDGAFFFNGTQAAIRSGQTKGTSDSSLKIRVNSATAAGASVTITRTADKTAPAIGTYGYWNSETSWKGVGVVLKTSTLSVGYVSVADADSAISSTTLYVDGKARAAVGASLGGTKLVATGLSQGAHRWHFVVRDIFNNTRTTPDQSFRVDTAKPKVTSSPRAYLTTGSVSTKTVPTKVVWSAYDACGIYGSWVGGSNGLDKDWGGRPKSVGTRIRFSRTMQFAAQVYDCRGQLSSLSKGPKTKATLDKQSKRKGYHGKWTATKLKKSLGGTEQLTKKKKSYVTYKVKARSIGWVATKAKDRGKAAVYVDGKKVATINLYSKKTKYAQQVFTKTWSKAGTHTIKIVSLSSKKVGVDAFTRLS